MKERDLYQPFQDKFKLVDPCAFCYKIPDFKGGGKRPFDMILITEGVAFAIEFKSRGKVPTPYQRHWLETFRISGGFSLVCTVGDDLNKFIDFIVKVRETQKQYKDKEVTEWMIANENFLIKEHGGCK